MRSRRLGALLVLLNILLPAFSRADSKPKYGPEATLLSQSHDYLQKHPAPDYWALSPYYVGQFNDKACSIGSVTMIVNAARVGMKLMVDDPLVTQQGLLKKLRNKLWEEAVGKKGRGVPLDKLGELIKESLTAYGIKEARVEVVPIEDRSDQTKAKLHQILLKNEVSSDNFIVANFVQRVYTGDAAVGHIAPVGAYDAQKKRVLIMDPDREWYEPYWVSEATFLNGMATKDERSKKHRGYVWIKVGK